MLARLVAASLRRRFRQLALILAAVAVATATVATLAGFSARAGRLLGEDLAAFGSNLTVRPQVGGPPLVPPAELDRVLAVAGVSAATGIAPAGAGPGLERIDVRADPGRLGEVAAAIEARVPGVEAKPLLRVSESDARITRRLTLVLAAVSGVSLLLALLSVAAATTALVGERRVEIGLLLALGYTARRVGRMFAAELLAAALLAGLVGELAGELAAASLAHRLLGAGTASAGPPVTWSGVAAAAAVAVLVVGASMAMALSRVERLDAAQVLKGD